MGLNKIVLKQLDMAKEARMARAKEQGFDTSKTWYHGTNSDVVGFSNEHLGKSTGAASAEGGIFLAKSPETANRYTELGTNTNMPKLASMVDEELEPLRSRFRELDSVLNNKVQEFNNSRRAIESEFISNYQGKRNRDGSIPRPAVNKHIKTKYEQHIGDTKQQWRDASIAIERKREVVLEDIKGRGGNVMQLYTNTKNPLVVDQKGSRYRDETYTSMIERAKAGGHDSVVIRNTYDGGPLDDVSIVFDPANIRSTNAAFDPANIGKNDLLGYVNPRLLAPIAAVGAAAVAAQNQWGDSQKDAITQHHLNNLETGNAVVNKDGSTSTVRTIQVDIDGKPTLIPTVWDGKIVSNDEAARRAIESGVQWPTAKTHEELRKFDQEIHKSFEADLKALPSSGDDERTRAVYQKYRENRASKKRAWELARQGGEALRTVAQGLVGAVGGAAFKMGGYLGEGIAPGFGAEAQGEALGNQFEAGLSYYPDGENVFLDRLTKEMEQFDKDMEPVKGPIRRGLAPVMDALPNRTRKSIEIAKDYIVP